MVFLPAFIIHWEFRMKGQEPIIEVKNLVVTYGEKKIIDNISFEVLPGEVFVILGGSGGGKTTVMNRMIGLELPTSGDVLIEKESIVQGYI